jgi:hypothetical protein
MRELGRLGNGSLPGSGTGTSSTATVKFGPGLTTQPALQVFGISGSAILNIEIQLWVWLGGKRVELSSSVGGEEEIRRGAVSCRECYAHSIEPTLAYEN